MMYSFNEAYLTYEMRRRHDEVEKLDRATAAYDHPFVERVNHAAALIERFRRIWMPAAALVSSERETREQPVICLNC